MMPQLTPDKGINNITIQEIRGVKVFTIRDSLTVSSSFDKLAECVRQAIEKGSVHIAFSFTSDSYMSTRLVANLVHFWKLIQDRSGSMGLIRPNTEILSVLKTIGLADLISIYDSENDVGVK